MDTFQEMLIGISKLQGFVTCDDVTYLQDYNESSYSKHIARKVRHDTI